MECGMIASFTDHFVLASSSSLLFKKLLNGTPEGVVGYQCVAAPTNRMMKCQQRWTRRPGVGCTQ